ncbi:MAG: hypothetical protein ACRDTZ_00130 [Pseudonocardiaceae bacterium]
MSMGTMNVVVEIWAVAADEHGIWLVSGRDAWRSAPIPSDSEPHFEVETILLGHDLPSPVLLHSTSWRPDGPHIVLTYVAVIPVTDLVRGRWPTALPVSADLLPVVGPPPAHGAAEVPVPRYVDVLHHGLRHLTLLRATDTTAREALGGHWATHLDRLEPALAGMYRAPA